MRLSVKATAISSGLVWGSAILFCGMINIAKRSYARPFLEALSSMYPGFRHSRSVADVLVGTGYGLIDGAATGALYAAIYNQFAGQATGAPSTADVRGVAAERLA